MVETLPGKRQRDIVGPRPHGQKNAPEQGGHPLSVTASVGNGGIDSGLPHAAKMPRGDLPRLSLGMGGSGYGERPPGTEVGEPDEPIERENSGAIPTAELSTALSLLESDEEWNTYASKAAESARNLIAEADTHSAFARQGKLEFVVQLLAEGAAKTGKEETAEYLWRRIPRDDKWLIAAEAHIAAELPSAQLSNWDTHLEQTVAQEQNPKVQAAMHVARIVRELHEYSAIEDGPLKESSLQRAQESRSEYKRILSEKPRSGSGVKSPLTENVKDLYDSFVNLAFARAGLWEEIDEDPFYTVPSKGALSKSVVKALHGKLGKVEAVRLGSFFRLGQRDGSRDTRVALSWINAAAKDEDVEVPHLQGNTLITPVQRLLEEIAPDKVKALGLEPFSPVSVLKVDLDNKDYQEALLAYQQILSEENDMDIVPAALFMSSKAIEVGAATAGLEVLRTESIGVPIDRELAGIEGYVDEQSREAEPNYEGIDEHLKELYSEAKELQHPQSALLLIARIARLYQQALPENPQLFHLRNTLRDRWISFEISDEMTDQLVPLGDSLRQLGFRFENRWKNIGVDKGGYLGYDLILPGDNPFGSSRHDTVFSLRDITSTSWINAASALNELHGRMVYQALSYPEPSSEFDWNTDARAHVEFAIPSSDDGFRELAAAVRYLPHHSSLNTRDDITRRLAPLRSQLVSQE